MEYGYCTGFATRTPFAIEYDVVEKVKAAGYDYVELPLMAIADLSCADYSKFRTFLEGLDIGRKASCNLFPQRVALVRDDADPVLIAGYLAKAMDRAAELGIKKLIFGSSPARDKPDRMSGEEAGRRFISVLKRIVIPAAKKRGLLVLIEPIQARVCNFIITLRDGLRIVEKAADPSLRLMADLCHLEANGEPGEVLGECLPLIHHIHVSEADRGIPKAAFSEAIGSYLAVLKRLGYDETISYETIASPAPQMARQLRLLRDFFES